MMINFSRCWNDRLDSYIIFSKHIWLWKPLTKLSRPFLEGGVRAARAPVDASCALVRFELTSSSGAHTRDTCSKPALTDAESAAADVAEDTRLPSSSYGLKFFFHNRNLKPKFKEDVSKIKTRKTEKRRIKVTRKVYKGLQESA